nr:hypothetical protein [Nocardia abscessus]
MGDPLGGGQRRPRVRQHGRAGLGRRDRAAATVEQWQAEFALQLTDLRAEPRLGQVQPGRRAGEVRLLGHGDEVAKLPQFHNYQL